MGTMVASSVRAVVLAGGFRIGKAAFPLGARITTAVDSGGCLVGGSSEHAIYRDFNGDIRACPWQDVDLADADLRPLGPRREAEMQGLIDEIDLLANSLAWAGLVDEEVSAKPDFVGGVARKLAGLCERQRQLMARHGVSPSQEMAACIEAAEDLRRRIDSTIRPSHERRQPHSISQAHRAIDDLTCALSELVVVVPDSEALSSGDEDESNERRRHVD